MHCTIKLHNRPNRKVDKAKGAPKPRLAAPAGLFGGGGGGGGGGLFDDDAADGNVGGGLSGSASSSALSGKPKASSAQTTWRFRWPWWYQGQLSSGLKGGPGLLGWRRGSLCAVSSLLCSFVAIGAVRLCCLSISAVFCCCSCDFKWEP